jgi:hypothetical protein
MEAIRKIVKAGVLAQIIDLPWKSKDMQVEIIVMPMDEAVVIPTPSSPGKSLKGRLKKYADPALLEKEQFAWKNHIAEKYGTL